MLTRKKAARFHLLLLDHGESFIDDHAVHFYPTETLASALGLRAARFWKGRVHCASWSLTFEPEDPEAPLLRVMLSEAGSELIEWTPLAAAGGGRGSAADAPAAGGFEVRATSVLHKLEQFQPYVSARLPSAEPLRFILLHTRAAAFLSTMTAVQQALRQPRQAAAAGSGSVLAASRPPPTFDLTGLVDPLETHELQLNVTRVRPMVGTAAILLLTQSRLYLQDVVSSDSAPLTHWPLSALKSTARRAPLPNPRAAGLSIPARRTSGGSARASRPTRPARSP